VGGVYHQLDSYKVLARVIIFSYAKYITALPVPTWCIMRMDLLFFEICDCFGRITFSFVFQCPKLSNYASFTIIAFHQHVCCYIP
jgi:hypothetical protein